MHETNSTQHETAFLDTIGRDHAAISFSAITALNLAIRLDATTEYNSIIQNKFSSIFKGSGNLGEPYTIQLKDGAAPHVVYSARNVPLPLQNKVQDELSRMESEGVILIQCHGVLVWWQCLRNLVQFTYA